jgi:hypothetical protein
MTDQTPIYKINEVLNYLHIKNPVLLGKGGEGWIYVYGNDAIKIYPRNSDKQYLQNIQAFQGILTKQQFSFDIPQIYEIGEIHGIFFTVEKRLHGTQMDKKIIGLGKIDRQKLYRNYYKAIRQVNAVSFQNLPYGQIIKTSESITSDVWTDFLIRILELKMEKIQESTRRSISDFDSKIVLFKILIKQNLASTQKNLVHCDYFINNVLVKDDLTISAILDFSVHAAVGDPRLDIAGVLTWNEIDPNINQEDYYFLYEIVKNDYGKDFQIYADLYLLFSSFYFADMDDPSFSVKNLNNDRIWSKYK